MLLNDILKKCFMDEVEYVKNPYFYIRDYEDKGVIVLLKKDKDITMSLKDLENVCFECPDLEQHEGLIKMILFHVNKENIIHSYTIASTKYKVLRSEIILYESLIGTKLTEVNHA